MTKVRSDSTLWPRTLDALADGNGMTKATFDAWLRGTTGQVQNGTLIVRVASAFALDWLENRLRPVIERTVNHLAGEPVVVRFEVGEEAAVVQPDLFVSGTYRDTYNSIVQVNRPSHYSSWYFHRAWLPLLGPDLWVIIWEMRTRCYWNKETGIKRDTFEATYQELGASIGMSRAKVYRLLNPKGQAEKATLEKFVLRQETKRRFSKGRGGMVNEKTVWQIRLDDPLTPEDEVRLAESL